jgi:hypothetical protein
MNISTKEELQDISTPEVSTLNLLTPWGFRVEGFILKKKLIEKSGVESLGLKLGVEKSGIGTG